MVISITNSSLDDSFINTFVSIEDEEVVINAQDFQVSNSSIKLTLLASTITIPSIENSTQLEIVIINESPIIQYSGDSVIVLKDQDITTSKTINVDFIAYDIEKDEILYSSILTSDSIGILPAVEVSITDKQFSVTFNAESLIVSVMTLEFKVWDKYHVNFPTQVDITFYNKIAESIKIHFLEDLPSNIIFVKCGLTTVDLPSIINPKNNAFTIEIVEDNLSFLFINSSSLAVKSFDGNYGNYSLTIRLIESDENSNYYPTTVNLVPPIYLSFGEFQVLKVKYMSRNKTLIGVPDYSANGKRILNSLMLSDYIKLENLKNFQINIRNNSYKWLYYDQSLYIIEVMDFERNDIRNYTVRVDFYNNCTNQFISKELFINLLDK